MASPFERNEQFDRVRVLHVNEHLNPKGGVETYLLSLGPHLVAAGIEPGYAYASGDPALASPAFHVAELAKADRRSLARGRDAMNEVLADFQPDIVHLHLIHNIGAIEACLSAAPVVVTAHDHRYVCPASNFYFKRNESRCQRTCSPACFAVTVRRKCMSLRPGYSTAYYRRVRWMMRNAERFAGVIAPSANAAGRMIAAGFPESRTHVLPYFCRVEPLPEPRPVPESPSILYLGRISENKGWRYFVRALGRLPAHVRGTLVGNVSGDRRRIVEDEATSAGCRDRLDIREWATEEEIVQLLRGTSVLVFPSLWDETLGIVGLEALSQGVPVVASDVGGVREWLHDGETGWLVPPGDAAMLAERIGSLVESPELNRGMGSNGIALIGEKFGDVRHTSRLMGIYEQAVAERARSVSPVGGTA